MHRLSKIQKWLNYNFVYRNTFPQIKCLISLRDWTESRRSPFTEQTVNDHFKVHPSLLFKNSSDYKGPTTCWFYRGLTGP